MNSSEASTTVAADGGQKPSTAVIGLLARVKGADPIELDPLYASIDPDALDALCRSDSGFESLAFDYSGHTVSITSVGSELEISVVESRSSFEGATGVEPVDTESSL